MGNIYDGAFRTILNDCRQMIIPVINEISRKTIQGMKRLSFILMNILLANRMWQTRKE